MLPGPIRIKKCGTCAGLLKQRTLTSGNTCGATYWTDGKMEAPMLPRAPALVRCPHCSAVHWMKGLEEVDSYETYLAFLIFEKDDAVREGKRAELEKKRERYEPVPFYEIPSFGDLVVFVASSELSLEEEFRARTQAWHTGNDSRRASDSPAPITPPEESNLIRLVAILDRCDSLASPITRAEALRELGRLDEALACLNAAELDEREEYVGEFIRELISAEDAQVCVVTREEDRPWRAKRRRERKLALGNPHKREIDPAGPPHFEILSTEWWFKVIGMSCHNWALIEDLGENGFRAYFFHDHGVSKNLVPGFSSGQIRGRSAVVDSLDFPSSYEAFDELEMNGFKLLEKHPGPWDGFVPQGPFFDARASEDGIYSKKSHWTSTKSLLEEYEPTEAAEGSASEDSI